MGKSLKELRDEILGSDACTACGTCVSLCPNIVSIEDRIAVIADCDIESGRCYRYCPRTTPEHEIGTKLFGDAGYSGAVGPYFDYYAARSTLSHKEAAFQYGGVISALMLRAMEEGLINRAVVTKAVSNLPVTVTVQSKKGIINAAGSKFALSPTNKEANKAATHTENRIGVVALPCQATGLRKRQLLPRDDSVAEGEVTLILGLFCTWALGQQGWLSVVKKHIGDAKVKRIDIPPPPANVMEITTNRKSYEIPLDEVRGYIRPGCKVCLDMAAENADLSVGMVEGREGFNAVIVRTELGKRLIESAIKSGYIQTDQLDNERWKHLIEASLDKKKRAIAEAENRGESLPYYSRIIELKEKISREEGRNES